MTKFTDFINNTITNSGNILRTGFGSKFQIDNKIGKNNLVTEYDYKSEKYIVEEIKKAFPTHNIISEEKGSVDNNSEYDWIIDPLDGTVNYANNIPIFSVSIALSKNGELIAGAVYQPILNELFSAELGKGAKLNGEPITVSNKSDMNTSLLVTGFPYDINNDPKNAIRSFTSIVKRGIPIRRLGSAALDLAYVACGRFEGFWEVNLNSWDVAAGILIVNEAGGKCTNYKGIKSLVDDKEILATNGQIHDEALRVINED
ncbi:MAG: inositol monophosphatase [Ignavibacteriae bacterium HGW-Ignavibacteriae-4]|jgi:myo-inositol-1(or 4)-monophosphatase|nr:MAG: inositol monophosphatase [Ignavibacteriae bacterium HGW-Ignavibacteriae-4]